MNQITIDREGAQAIGDMLITGHPQAVDQICNAFLAAAAGDFAPLAELVGTREVEGAPARSKPQACPSEDCPACNGEACWKCGAGTGSPPPERCEHDHDERHERQTPAPAPDFREGDVVRFETRVLPINGDMRAFRVNSEPWHEDHPWLKGWRIKIVNLSNAEEHEAYTDSLVLTHRRHFRAGERCGTVAVGQERMHPTYGAVRLVPPTDSAMIGYACTEDARARGTAFVESVSGWPLAADYSAPEAVEVKP